MSDEVQSGQHEFLLGEAGNTAYGTTHGVNSGYIRGDITQNIVAGASSVEPELIDYRRTPDEVDRALRQFVQPDGFQRAGSILARSHVVVLCGPGTGREHAALGLLKSCAVREIMQMSPQRTLKSVRADDLDDRSGYIWVIGDSAERPFSDREFTQCATTMREMGCYLVIVLDRMIQASAAAEHYAVSLAVPDQLEVARSALNYLCPANYEEPAMVLKTHLQAGLETGDPPAQAARAAELAIAVAAGELTADEALRQLKENVETAVARWFRDWDLREYSLALAIAVLENESWDEVVSQARELDESLRLAQLPQDRTLRPRRVFDKSKFQLVQDVNARVDEREHPRYAGLREETVRFVRQGWAAAVLRHVWQEYPSAHSVVHEWLCDLANAPARNALCTIVATVPARDPLRLVNDLARKQSKRHRRLAATALVSLADHHDLLPLVRKTLHTWAVSGSAFEKWTAAAVYCSVFGQREMDEALAQLARIAKAEQRTSQDAVIGGMLSMLRNAPDHRERLVDEIVSWAQAKYRRTGLGPVSLSLALWMLGFTSRADRNLVALVEPYGAQVNILANRVMDDLEFGSLALDRLSALASAVRLRSERGPELVRLATLIVPDLRWWHRRSKVAQLVELHSWRRNEIRRTFRAARRCERRAAQDRTGRRPRGNQVPAN